MKRCNGLTLIELLVALAIMATMSAMAWRSMDALLGTREATQNAAETVQGWQGALAQWHIDLNEMAREVPQREAGAMAWGAKVNEVRFVRHARQGGWHVVAWGIRDGRWTRWQSPAATSLAELDRLWNAAEQGLTSDGVRMVRAQGFDAVGRFKNQWGALASAERPQAVRLVLRSEGNAPVSGELDVLWVSEAVAGGKQ